MGKLRRILKLPVTICAGMVFGAFVVCIALWQCGVCQDAELFVYDHSTLWRAKSISGAESRITVIGMNDADLRRVDHPLTDEALSKVIEKIASFRPAVIGLDLYRDVPVPPSGEQSARLLKVLQEHQNVICAIRLGGGQNAKESVPPPPNLEDPEARCGFTDFPYDHRAVRRALLFAKVDGVDYMSLAMQVTLAYLDARQIESGQDPVDPALFRVGSTALPRFEKNDGANVDADAGGYQMFMDFCGPAEFRTLSLNDLTTGNYLPAEMEGGIVLVGVTASTVKDYLSTPLRYEHRGIELHAQVIDQLLRLAEGRARPLRVWPDLGEAGWLFGWCIVAGLTAFFVRTPWLLALALFAEAALILSVSWWLFQRDWWVPSVLPLGGALLSAALVTIYVSFFETRERKLVTQLFRRNASIADTILQRRDEFLNGGRLVAKNLTATVLFTDLRGFAARSEAVEPVALLGWLNQIQEAMTREVNQHHGVVISYGGDALMAAFGVPIERRSEDEIRQDARNAVQCALAMKSALEGLNAKWIEAQVEPASMRIGIHTGVVVAGCIGSAERMEFTVVGDTTNIAARLESLDRQESPGSAADVCRILIGDATYEHVGKLFCTEDLGLRELKGKRKHVRVHRVPGDRSAGEIQPL